MGHCCTSAYMSMSLNQVPASCLKLCSITHASQQYFLMRFHKKIVEIIAWIECRLLIFPTRVNYLILGVEFFWFCTWRGVILCWLCALFFLVVLFLPDPCSDPDKSNTLFYLCTASYILSPILWVIGEVLSLPFRAVFVLSNSVSAIFIEVYYMLIESWSSIFSMFQVASASKTTVTGVAYESSVLKTLWNDLFSQVSC